MAAERKRRQSQYKPLPEIKAEILALIDISKELEAAGIKFTGPAKADGWRPCIPFDRPESNKSSAAVCVAGDNGHLGQYTDLGGGRHARAMSFWDLMVALQPARFSKYREVIKFYADQVGVPMRGPKLKEAGGSPLDDIEFIDNPLLNKILVNGLSKAKAGTTLESLVAAGARVVKWHNIQCIAFFGVLPGAWDKIVAVILYRLDGKPWPATDKLPERKCHTVGGSKDSLIVIGGLAAVEAAHTIIKVEGPPDSWAMFAAFSAESINGYAIVTNVCGARSWSKELAEVARGKKLIVVHDADAAGEAGADCVAANSIGIATDIRHPRLPYEIAESHGKDSRDWIVEGGTASEFLKLAAAAPSITCVPEPVANGIYEDESITPIPIQPIIDNLHLHLGDWPRRVDTELFIHNPDGIYWLDNASSLFGYIAQRTGVVEWFRSTGCVSKDELFHELRRQSIRYKTIEYIPHQPPIVDHYYACKVPVPGDGSAMTELVDRFSPATPIDRELIIAMFATPFWGGLGGTRPIFLITSDEGRGVGKSKLTDIMSHLLGGHVELSQNEDAAAIRKRLLSPEGINKRMARLDNVKALKFSWSDLESMVTAPTISGHKMYAGEGSRPNNITWFLTLNGVNLSTDIAQRAVIIQLTKPKRSGDWESETVQFINDNRERIIGDLLAFLSIEPAKLSAHTRWAAWECAVLSKLENPEAVQAEVAKRSGDADADGDEMGIIEEYFATQLARYNYNPEVDRVHIPSKIAADWFNQGANQRHATNHVTTIIKQAIGEGKINKIIVNPSRTYGRGFIWLGNGTGGEDNVNYGLQDRIQIKKDLFT